MVLTVVQCAYTHHHHLVLLQEVLAFGKDDVIAAANRGGAPEIVYIYENFGNPVRLHTAVKASSVYYDDATFGEEQMWVSEYYAPATTDTPEYAVDPAHDDGMAISFNVNHRGLPVKTHGPVVVNDHIFTGPHVRSLAFYTQLFKPYAAVTRCTYLEGFECRIEYHELRGGSPWTLNMGPFSDHGATQATSLRVPPGAEGISFRTNTIEHVVLFSSGAEGMQVPLQRMKGDVDDSVYRFRPPILRSQPARLMENIVFVRLLVWDIVKPRCLVKWKGSCAPITQRKLRAVEPGRHVPLAVPHAQRQRFTDAQAYWEDAMAGGGLHRDGHGLGHAHRDARALLSVPAGEVDQSSCLGARINLFSKSYIFFEYEQTYIIYIIPVTFFINAGGDFRVDLGIDLCINDRQVILSVIPSVGVHVTAGAKINIFVAYAGIRIVARVLTTSLIPFTSFGLVGGGGLRVCLGMRLKSIPLTILIQTFANAMICWDWYSLCFSVGFSEICIPIPFPWWCNEWVWLLYKWSARPINRLIWQICNGPTDRTPPEAGVVEARQADPTTFSATWRKFYDPDTDIVDYHVCIGTSPGASNLWRCRSVGTSTSVIAQGVRPAGGAQCYVTVIAFNEERLKTGVSASMQCDSTPPQVYNLQIRRPRDLAWVNPHCAKWGFDLPPGWTRLRRFCRDYYSVFYTNDTEVVQARFQLREPERDSETIEAMWALGTYPRADDEKRYTDIGYTAVVKGKKSTVMYVDTRIMDLKHDTRYWLTVRTKNDKAMVGHFPSIAIHVVRTHCRSLYTHTHADSHTRCAFPHRTLRPPLPLRSGRTRMATSSSSSATTGFVPTGPTGMTRRVRSCSMSGRCAARTTMAGIPASPSPWAEAR